MLTVRELRYLLEGRKGSEVIVLDERKTLSKYGVAHSAKLDRCDVTKPDGEVISDQDVVVISEE